MEIKGLLVKIRFKTSLNQIMLNLKSLSPGKSSHYFIHTILLILITPAILIPVTAVVVEVEINGEISQGTFITIEKAFKEAEKMNASAILIIINTPGGLVSSTEKIISLILNSRIPVITYVYPQGAFSASAGSFILISGHIAAMSSGTSVGAATPVGIGITGVSPVENKTINYIASYARSIAEKRGRPANIAEKFVTESLSLTSKEAFEVGIVDVLADTKEDLFTKINGKKIKLDGQEVTLHLSGDIIRIQKPLQAQIFELISNPQVAGVLFLIGVYGLIFGLTSPGILSETIGAISLVLSLVGLGAIGINVLGILLVLLGIVFLAAELLTPTYGVLGAASVISITLGTLMLIDEPLMPMGFYISFYTLVAGIGIGTGAVMTFILIKIFRLKKARKKVGGEALIGQKGEVIEFKDREGFAKIRGEIWRVKSDQELSKGERIIVRERDGLTLIVDKIEESED